MERLTLTLCKNVTAKLGFLTKRLGLLSAAIREIMQMFALAPSQTKHRTASFLQKSEVPQQKAKGVPA
jgi:hypothetical protein